MKRNLEKVAPEDYAHYTQQLKLQLGMFENLAPNGSAADKQRALDHAHCMVVQASLAATAFARLIRAERTDPPGTAGRVGGVGDPVDTLSDLHK